MTITDFETWLKDFGDERRFRIHKNKRLFTPYEADHKFIDQEVYDYLGEYQIIEAIQLPNNDILLGCRYWDEDELSGWIEYFKLSEIDLQYFPEEY